MYKQSFKVGDTRKFAVIYLDFDFPDDLKDYSINVGLLRPEYIVNISGSKAFHPRRE